MAQKNERTENLGVTLTDYDDNVVGTPDNPLYVAGGTGGGGAANPYPGSDYATAAIVQAVRDRLPAAFGAQSAANSLSVAISTDGVIANAFGPKTDASTPDTSAGGASFSFVSLFKGMVDNLLAAKTALVSLLAVQQPVQGIVAMAVGAADTTAGRGLRIVCTAAGNVTLKYKDGSSDTIPVNVGYTRLGDAIVAVTAATATATYAKLI